MLFIGFGQGSDYKVTQDEIQPFVYHLELEGEYHYVGMTKNLNQRWTQHTHGKGSKWTKLHKPIKIGGFWVGSQELENNKTYELMDKYGIDKVRGGICHCPVLSECEKFGCKVHSSEDTEQFEIGKRIRFVLENDWVQQILFTLSRVRDHRRCATINYDDIAYIKKSFKFKSGKWYLYHEKNQAMNYYPLHIQDYNLHYGTTPNSHDECHWAYILPIHRYINTIYKIHFKLGDLGLRLREHTQDPNNYDIITLYNLFKNQ